MCPRRRSWLLVIACCFAPSHAASQRQDPDSMSVEELVAAARVGEYGLDLAPTIERAARGCRRADAGSWERRVVSGLLETPLASFFGADAENWRNNASGRVAEAMSYAIACREVGVEEWIRAALYAELGPEAYIPLVDGLVRGNGVLLVDDVSADAEADPAHRLWATETLIAGPSLDGLEPPIPGSTTTRQIKLLFSQHGLPDAYVEKWLPLLLASEYTREAVVSDLVPVLGRAPQLPGAAAILRILGPNVQAYDHRFSEDAQTAVRDLLADLTENADELPADVSAALRDVAAARAERRNHLGVPVRTRGLSLDATETGGACTLTGPEAVIEAVEQVVPGLRVQSARGCPGLGIQYGDFDGDGGRDVLINVAAGPDPSPVVVLSGEVPRALLLPGMRPDWEARVQPPGASRADYCRSPEFFTFPNDYITAFSFYTGAVYRFDGTGFVQVAPPSDCAA